MHCGQFEHTTRMHCGQFQHCPTRESSKYFVTMNRIWRNARLWPDDSPVCNYGAPIFWSFPVLRHLMVTCISKNTFCRTRCITLCRKEPHSLHAQDVHISHSVHAQDVHISKLEFNKPRHLKGQWVFFCNGESFSSAKIAIQRSYRQCFCSVCKYQHVACTVQTHPVRFCLLSCIHCDSRLRMGNNSMLKIITHFSYSQLKFIIFFSSSPPPLPHPPFFFLFLVVTFTCLHPVPSFTADTVRSCKSLYNNNTDHDDDDDDDDDDNTPSVW